MNYDTSWTIIALFKNMKSLNVIYIDNNAKKQKNFKN